MATQRSDAPPGAIRSVAVIGAGRHGRGFAKRCAEAGYRVALQDVLWSKLREAEDELGEAPAGSRERVTLANSVEDAVREADLAIDFVPDELESKLEIFSMMDRMAPPRTIFCSPTLLSISDLAACTYRAERCFSLVSLVQQTGGPWIAVRPPEADQDASDQLVAFFAGLDQTVVVEEEQAVP